MSDSRLHGSSSSSRPFLNLLNPMGRNYRGYAPMGRDRVDEDDEDDGEDARERPPTSSARRVSFGNNDDHDSGSSDGEVPQSFMIEATPSQPPVRAPPPKAAAGKRVSNKHHPILPTTNPRVAHPSQAPSRATSAQETRRTAMGGLDARERALWNWVNVYNLDAYLQEVCGCRAHVTSVRLMRSQVYAYYEGKGIYCIALARALNLLCACRIRFALPRRSTCSRSTIGFVIAFSTFLLGCVDYPRLRHEGTKHLSDVVVDRCLSRCASFALPCGVL